MAAVAVARDGLEDGATGATGVTVVAIGVRGAASRVASGNLAVMTAIDLD